MWNGLCRIPNPVHSGVSRVESLKFCSTKTQKNLIKEGWTKRDRKGWMDDRERNVMALMD